MIPDEMRNSASKLEVVGQVVAPQVEGPMLRPELFVGLAVSFDLGHAIFVSPSRPG
jgi:hypothetical protein